MTFLPKLKADLEAFVEGWNNHPHRTEGNRTPEKIWHTNLAYMRLLPLFGRGSVKFTLEPFNVVNYSV